MTTKQRAAAPVSGISMKGRRKCADPLCGHPIEKDIKFCGRGEKCECVSPQRRLAAFATFEAALSAKLDEIRAECQAILHKGNPYEAAHHILRICNEVKGAKS